MFWMLKLRGVFWRATDMPTEAEMYTEYKGKKALDRRFDLLTQKEKDLVWLQQCLDGHKQTIARLEKWKELGDHQVMNLQRELQKVEQERDDLRQNLAGLKGGEK
jgi:predicted  nucleic acid-binding Zn-ribbon protein